jgi:lipopolysaccharide/colanic/teichoic acid biosynthesis glycosyltransferase
MLPFIGILVAVIAMVAMAYTTQKDERLYRFTSTGYGKDKHAIFEIRSTSIENAKEAGNQALALYNERRVSRIEWELIEELDPNNKQILTVLYKLPVEEMSAVKS